MSVSVVLVDDQPLVRSGFRLILESEPDIRVIGEAGDGKHAVQLVRELGPDVVLLDIQMPGGDGIEALAEMMRLRVPSRVVMLTTFDLDRYVYDALRLGAAGFLLKTVEPTTLVDAVRNVAQGHLLVAPALTRRLVDAFVGTQTRNDTAATLAASLTERERDVVRAIARGLSNNEIAAALFLSEATVKTHVVHVLAKLNLRDRTQIAILAYEAGLVTAGESDESA